jgi:DNA-binding GntR family transcriptional regulator
MSGNQHIPQMVTMKSVCEMSGLSRETVRRAIHKLAEKGFAIKINDLWIYKDPS